MNRCQDFQTQMLDYVYELVDDDVRDALRAHVEVCPHCQLALNEAQGQQQLLASAARLEFPAVQFAPPAPEPVVLPMQRAVRPPRVAWRRYLAAAAILIALGIPASLGLDFADAKRDLKKHEDAIARLDADRRELNNQAVALEQERHATFEAKRNEVLANHRQPSLSGPQQFLPGGSNEYKIALLDGNNREVAGRIESVKIIDQQRNKVVYEERNLKTDNGLAKLNLPPNLDADLYSHLKMTVGYISSDGQTNVMEEDFSLSPATYLTHLTTDKPMYQPGETVRFRSLSLDRFSLEPSRERLSIRYTMTTPQGAVIEIPQGDVNRFAETGVFQGAAVFGPDHKMLRGIGGGEWDVPAAFPGGEYTLTVLEDQNRFPAQTRKFIVNKFRKPRLLTELVFNRRTYGPGDEVLATCKAMKGKEAVADCKALVSVQVDGKNYDASGKESVTPFELKTDSEGKVLVRFALPKEIDRGQASVNVAFHDGGSPESLLKPIPIALKKLDIEFYPEGGYFVKHAPTRVYVQARTTLGKPAELKGRLMNDLGDVEAYVETLADDEEPGVNQGMAMFRFIPRPNRKYHLEIDRPTGIAQKEPLKTDEWGVVAMSVPRAVTTSHEPIEVKLRSYDETRRLFVGAYCRGRLFDHERVVAPAGQDITVTLKPTRGVGGVYRVTVFEEEQTGLQRPRLIPRAERLIFRHQRERLNLEVAQTKSKETNGASTTTPKMEAEGTRRSLDTLSSIPGGKVSLTVNARGENQEPVPAVVLIGVIDQSVLKLADEKTARSMPTHFFLMSEVRKPEELEFADFLLTTHPKASDSLDLLLGTQGWRRFVEQKPGELREKLMEEQAALAVLPSISEVPRVVKARADIDEKRTIDARLRVEAEKIDAAVLPERQKIQARYEALTKERQEASVAPAFVAEQARVQKYLDLGAIISRLWPLVVLTSLLVMVVLIGRGMTQSMRRATLSFAGAGLCLVIAVLTVVFSTSFSGRTRSENFSLAFQKGMGDEEFNGAKQVILFDNSQVESQMRMIRSMEDDNKGEAGNAGNAFSGLPDITTAVRPTPEEKQTIISGGPTPQPSVLPPPMAPGGWNAARGGAKGFGGAGDKGMGVDPKQGKPGDGKAGDDRADHFDPHKADKDGEGKFKARTELRKNLMKEDEADVYASPMKAGMAKESGKRDLQNHLYRQRMQLLTPLEGKEPEMDAPHVMAGYFLREFAHRREDSAKKTAETVRQDFTDTVYWHPALVLPDGKIDISFMLSDSVTTYQVLVYGHTLDGRIAAAKPFTFDTRLPLALDSAVPNEIAASDTVIVPVTLANGTKQDQQVRVTVTKAENLRVMAAKPTTTETGSVTVQPLSTTRRLFNYQPSVSQGQARFEVEGTSAPYADRLSRIFNIVPEGFPFVESRSDLLEGGSAKHDVMMPKTWVKGTLKVRLSAFPSTLADLQSGLEGLLREPSGCFEQTSTTNYPNVLILSYLKETDQAKPELERKVRELMERGYQKLTSFECQKSGLPKREGYEWFGGSAPPHEALTAYGLLQFRDMARHHEVDRDMLDRTRKYLLGRRDGKGGFERNTRALDSFGRAPDHITNAYIVWALTESGPSDDLQREVDALIETAKTSKDPYFLALVANSLINRAKTGQAIPFLKTVAGLQKAEGVVDGATTSITGSGGRDLQIETTSLALPAWLRADPGQFAVNIDNASKWIGKQRGGYGAFGSTQSTILALKALIAHAKETKKPREDGVLKLWVNEQLAGETAFSAKASETLVVEMKEPEQFVQGGKNRVRIEVTGKNQFPYTLTWDYKTLTPASDAKSVVKLATKFDRPKVNEGESVRMTVNVENASDKGQGMAVAIIGIPGGLTLPEDLKQLTGYKELPKDGSRPLISTFEIRGRELILYWRDLAPNQKLEVPIDLSCRVPGEYSGPASRAYLYYNGDHKTWVEPLRIRIDPLLTSFSGSPPANR